MDRQELRHEKAREQAARVTAWADCRPDNEFAAFAKPQLPAVLVANSSASAAFDVFVDYRTPIDSSTTVSSRTGGSRRPCFHARLGHTFNALLDRVGQANERERQFLADASYTLRSPVALMRTELEVATLQPRTDTETRAAFESLGGQVERLIILSNPLLDLEELRASGAMAQQPVDIVQILTDVADRYRPGAAPDRRSVHTPAPAGHHVDGHPHWLDLALGGPSSRTP